MTNDYLDYLQHHGVKGQHWGERRYQYEDGSLTPEGYEHYGYGDGGDNVGNREPAPRTTADIINIARKTRDNYYQKQSDIGYKASKWIDKNKTMLMAVGGVAAVAGMAMIISKAGNKTVKEVSNSSTTNAGANAVAKVTKKIAKTPTKNLNTKSKQQHDALIWHNYVQKHKKNYTAVKTKSGHITSANYNVVAKHRINKNSKYGRGPLQRNNYAYAKKLSRVGKVFRN